MTSAMALLGCPFCREMFSEGEAEACPVCGVPLRPVEKLPPSYEARVALAQELAKIAPEDRVVPFGYLRRGRGALALVGVLGLVAFFAPWVSLVKPDEITFSGYALARARGGWFFGGAVGWLVLVPLVLSRRTVYKMRGVRIIAGMFAALSVVETVQLLVHPPRGGRYVPVEYTWSYGLYATLALGVVGMLLAARFGGRLDDIDVRELTPDPIPDLSPDQSEERTIH